MPRYRIECGVEWPGGHEEHVEVVDADTVEKAQEYADECAQSIMSNNCSSWAAVVLTQDGGRS